MNYIFEHNELDKIFKRFNKIRLLHKNGYRNLLPIDIFRNNPNKYKQIQLNTNFHFNAIIMDIDNEELLTEWNHKGLPTPTIQTINKNNNKAHIVWLLKTPVWKEHKHALSYYKAIVNSIKKLIGADEAYQNHETKNFLNTDLYRVTYNDLAYELGDFKKFISKDENNKFEHEDFNYLVAGSRHIDLFEKLRRYGYKIANEPDLKKRLTKKAEDINQYYSKPIKVKYIVDSIYKFCEKYKHNFKSSNIKKVMKFDKIKNLSKDEFDKEVKSRQSKSAARTSSIKKLRTSIKIKIAIEKLTRLKQALTYKNISSHAKISISTVRRNIKIIEFFCKKSSGSIRSIRLIVQRAKQLCTLLSSNAIFTNYKNNSCDFNLKREVPI